MARCLPDQRAVFSFVTATMRRLLLLLPIPLTLLRHYPLVQIRGRSMSPTLNPDSNMLAQDVVLFDRVSVQADPNSAIQRGDIVSVRHPGNPRRVLVKRVVGLPGDTLRESESSRREIPAGHMWIEGDDPAHSDDSRAFGCVPLGLVQARMVCVVWPWWRAGWRPGVTSTDKLELGSPQWKDAVDANAREERVRSRVQTW